MDMPVIYRIPCDTWYSNAKIEPCIFGTEAAKKTVVFLGDSIGAQWFSIIPVLYPEPIWRTVVLTKSACAMVDKDYFYQRIGKIYQVCTDWRNAVLEYMNTLKPEVLIMGNAATYNFTETQWIEGSSRILERLSKTVGVVFVIPGTPSLNFDGPGCVSQHISPEGYIDSRVCSVDKSSTTELITHYLEQAINRFPNVHMLNLNDLVCPDRHCSAVSKDGNIVFRDSQHLTDSFVRAQIPFIRERLKRFNKD